MIYRVLLLVVLVSAIGPSPSAAQEDTRAHDDAWSRVAAFEREGLPRSAAAVVDSIYGLARNSGDMPQLIRALLHRIRYTAALEEQAADSLVADVHQAIGEAPAPGRALLHSILAELYMRYYRQHRRQIQNRTAVHTVRDEDFQTWGSKTFIRQAMRHYLASVAPAETLQSLAVEEYETVLVEAPESRSLRPTLYDFLVHRAIDFFERGEAGLLAPERALMLEGSGVFAPAQAFIRLEPADDGSPDAHALKLLQDLLAFHAEREETAAYLEADLRRLKFVYQYSVATAKDSLYIAGLEDLRRRHAGHPAVTNVTLAMARWYEMTARHEWQNDRSARQTAFDHDGWLNKKQARDEAHAAHLRSHEAEVARLDAEYEKELTEWERKRDEFIAEREEANKAIDEQTARYERKEPEAVVEYCDLVLSNSSYPDYFPQEYRLDFVSETGILIVDYQLPPKESLPTLKEVRYIQSRDEFKEKHVSDSQLNSLYDTLLYQIALRTIHELFEADSADALKAIVFNGYVNSIDPATGIEGNPCILSVQAAKDEFMAMNLSRIDPKACFKKLKGVSSSKLHTLTQVKPLKQILSREDDRFTDSYDVIDGLEGTNLAAMDWKEFEHFVREIFEKIFSDAGGEVKVTQASRDGGVDAIAFDPDPIRGGKIVIQAKRYVNTVGVTAVRDLWGTVNHEGAMKGILVTTSDFGPDAYTFASDKPLQLIGGGELLHLLEQHGHKARIDLPEARKLQRR